MADITKRTKQARKQAEKRAKDARKRAEKRAKATAKTTRKAVAQTTVRRRARAIGIFGLAIGAAAAVLKLTKGGGGDGRQRYSTEPDNLPNTPDRPAATTPPPGAGTRETGADTGTMTETERARVEQTG